MIIRFLFLCHFTCLVSSELMKGYKAAESNTEEQLRNERSLLAQCQAVADMKFTYVVSCQQYGIQKRSGDAKAQDILRLMTTYVSNIELILMLRLDARNLEWNRGGTSGGHWPPLPFYKKL